MSNPESSDALAKALDQLARSKGVELPNIPSSPGRVAYLRFLSDRGYREDELLPVIRQDRVTAEMKASLFPALMQATQSNDPKFIKMVIWMAHNSLVGRDNTNLIINELATALTKDLAKADITIPPFYAGVFPTDSYNAQCTLVNGQNIVLIDTGCMEMAETLVICFLSKVSTSEKIKQISLAIDNYVLRGDRADAFNLNTLGVDFGSLLPGHMTNCFEEYIIAHELGHLALGHATDQRVRHHSPRIGLTLEVVDKSEFQEFEADVWACRALLTNARNRQRSDSDVALAVAGLSLGLGVGLLVEASAAKHGISLSAGHPPSHERLYMMEVAYELFGVHEDAYIGRRVHELVEEIIRSEYPSARMAPFLDRDLNRKMLGVLDSLKVDYSRAPYITDFT